MSLKTICLPVQHELKQVEDLILKEIASEVKIVNEVAKHVLQNGGKRIRPAVILLTSKLVGSDIASAVHLAASIEMIHAASLLHDDVLDNAAIRRGKQSANSRWGNQISILVGDFLWSRASNLALNKSNNKILGFIIQTVEKITEGEILEIVKSNNFEISRDEYLKIITLKTAKLFECAAGLGALVVNSASSTESTLKEYGLNLGIAFQLADDVLDYISNEEVFGKKAGTDLIEGKTTLPLILALKLCTEEESHGIREALLSNKFDSQIFGYIKGVLKKYNAIEASLEIARGYSNLAKEALSKFRPSIEKDALMALADYAVSRLE